MQLSPKSSTRRRHPKVPNRPDTEYISVTYPSMMVVMMSIVQFRRQHPQLFHPVFGHFLDDIADEKMEVPQEVLQAAACLMASASGIYESEDRRKPAIFPHLTAALSTGMTKIVNLDLTSPDGVISLPIMGDIHETVALLLAEDKREIGEGCSDPSILASLLMIRFWAQQDNVRTHGISAQL